MCSARDLPIEELLKIIAEKLPHCNKCNSSADYYLIYKEVFICEDCLMTDYIKRR